MADDASAAMILGLRIVHALAAVVWLGGGIYYLVALRPNAQVDEIARATAVAAQQRFAEWSNAAAIAMVATGVILAFDRLAEGFGWVYYLTLGVKVGAALAAFLVTTMLRRAPAFRPGWARVQYVVVLGVVAYVLGVTLSSVWT
jgi:uncharacterized membrane protein